MARSVPQFPRIDNAVLVFSSQLDSIRQDLYYCDVSFAKGRMREIGRNVRAAAYVYLAAALERVVSDLLTATLAEISGAAPEMRELRLSLFSLIQASHLDSLQEIRGLKMWLKRSEIFALTDAQATCVFNDTLHPLDGRTIRPEHLDVIWLVFGFPSPAVPDPVTRLALTELADTRNSIAHGHETPALLGGQKSVTEMLKLIDRVEAIVIHMWTTITSYIQNKRYLRT